MKKFELRPTYYPKGSYLNYILEIWVDEVNISQFYEDNKLRIDVGYIFHIYNFFDDYLEDIMRDKIEISWDTTWDITYQQRKYENENIKFISTKGVSYIDANEFYLEIKKFLKKIDNISKIQNEKFHIIEKTGKLIYAKDPYNNIEFKEEKEFLQDLEKIGYKLFTIYELVLIIEKDKKVVPIVLKYLSKIEDENIKTHLAYFLAVKNYKEASEKLIKEFYNAKTNEYKIALLKALSTIYNKDILNELLEIARNKEYKDVNFPIIFTLRKYRDRRVKIFFEKQ